MNEIGIAPHVVECILNHRSGFRAGVSGVYNRAVYQKEMTEALARWGEYVLALAEGRKSKITTLRRPA